MKRPQRKRQSVEVFCNCFGYHGFGTGWVVGELQALGKRPLSGREGYCNGCPLAMRCWKRHMDRVREMLPDLCKVVDGIYREKPGPEGVQDVLELCKGQEPYLTVSLGNMEDGTAVALGSRPRNREQDSLTWPLKVLR